MSLFLPNRTLLGLSVLVAAAAWTTSAASAQPKVFFGDACSDNVVEDPDWESLTNLEQQAFVFLQADIDAALARLNQPRFFQRFDPEAGVLMELAHTYERLACFERSWERHVFDSQVRNCLFNGFDDCLDTIRPDDSRSESYERLAVGAYWLLLGRHPTHPVAEQARFRLEQLLDSYPTDATFSNLRSL